MVYQEKYEKKVENLFKTSIDIKTPFNSDAGNFVLVMNPALRDILDFSLETLLNNLMITNGTG